MRFEVGRARELFHRGTPLMAQLPADVRPDVDLFQRGGLAILRKIEKGGYDVLARRPALAKWDKAALLGGVLWRRVRAALA
jgi:phytoene/squalene synthetase